MGALLEPLRLLYLIDRQPADDHRRCLQVNALMLDPHQNYPHVAVPVYLFLLRILNYSSHHLLYFVPETLGVFKGRPLIMRLAQVVPVHLIHTDCEHPFVGLVDSLAYQPLVEQLVHKKGSSVSVVKDQRVSERLGLRVEGATALDNREELFIEFVSLVEIAQKFSLEVRQFDCTGQSLA